MGFILYLLSIILSFILFPFGYAYGFFKQVYKRKFFASFKTADKKFYKQACSIDRYGNVVCAELFNAVLIVPGSAYPFGNDRETISSTLGRNFIANNLTPTGKRLCRLLHWLDRDHVIKSIGF
jgi:hypothetical protein